MSEHFILSLQDHRKSRVKLVAKSFKIYVTILIVVDELGKFKNNLLRSINLKLLYFISKILVWNEPVVVNIKLFEYGVIVFPVDKNFFCDLFWQFLNFCLLNFCFGLFYVFINKWGRRKWSLDTSYRWVFIIDLRSNFRNICMSIRIIHKRTQKRLNILFPNFLQLQLLRARSQH